MWTFCREIVHRYRNVHLFVFCFIFVCHLNVLIIINVEWNVSFLKPLSDLLCNPSAILLAGSFPNCSLGVSRSPLGALLMIWRSGCK